MLHVGSQLLYTRHRKILARRSMPQEVQQITLCMTGACIPQVAIYRCLLDIAAGMDYLHSLGVLHGESILTYTGASVW